MKAVGFYAPQPISASESLVDLDIPSPTPGPRDLLVRVQAISVNPVDTKVRKSTTPPAGAPRILGYDAAGTVEAVGSEVTLFRKGDEVFYSGTIGRPGTNAELHLVDERIVGKKPTSLDFAEAASLPLTAITAWELLFERLDVPYGRRDSRGTLLVVNGAGGVGSILIQLARRLTGLRVVATASRPETVAWVEKMGAHDVIDHKKPLDQELQRLGIPQVEFIASLSGSDLHHAAYIAAIAPEGHLALIDDPKTFDIVPFKRKSVSVAWEFMFTRSVPEARNMIEQHRLLTEVASLVDAKVLIPTLRDRVAGIDAANLKKAHALLESGQAIGKFVLTHS